jgi:hypothetical protein
MCASLVLELRSSSCVMSGNLTVVHCKERVKKQCIAVDINNLAYLIYAVQNLLDLV